ncbi:MULTISPECIES: hypothetical protein [Pseudomonas syringae group]|uniref:Methylmuconolactone methyl-isomerase n=1 Tax=Pseudomonas coronafaciens pv. coronafaciens TaxID=235275 RepID=A0AAE6QIW5_9PSED|nr:MULTISPECIES: hypothetical protein [Pseudomonas syringae group]MCF5715693.1 hypothetical protein [Pseudomonas tremae]MCF5744752.1 hypothetical protein [Pseudomonas tremae]QGT82566.1 hypothetical protein GMO17_15955 [Pseudomonas coronafaciens pv. coronafaciens]QIQ70383.1 hypothetical protein HBB04_00734 [Pseudomonas coronafaciens]RMM76333.1 hypothetical protein ALQ71_01203 [Pseudomonas coronafaciens pv. striafaciens]
MHTSALPDDYGSRDENIVINSYTTVLRRDGVPHALFATYWRDVHGPLCARLPGLGWYVQHHLTREKDGHLWPVIEGVKPLPGYVLDGGVEIGFLSAEDQKQFKDASSLLFTDEQNMFAETIAYDVPDGSSTLVDRLPDPIPNETATQDKTHLHFHLDSGDRSAARDAVEKLAREMASADAVLKLRLHLAQPYDNAQPAPPAPDVNHEVEESRLDMVMMEVVFESAWTRRTYYASEHFKAITQGLGAHVRYVTPFGVSGVYTYVRDAIMTAAGVRGSRQAQLIRQLGAINQTRPEIESLFGAAQSS